MNDIRVTQSQLKPENLEQSELEYSFFLSNIHIPIRNIHIPTSNIHIPIVNIHIPTSLKLSIQYSIGTFIRAKTKPRLKSAAAKISRERVTVYTAVSLNYLN